MYYSDFYTKTGDNLVNMHEELGSLQYDTSDLLLLKLNTMKLIRSVLSGMSWSNFNITAVFRDCITQTAFSM